MGSNVGSGVGSSVGAAEGSGVGVELGIGDGFEVGPGVGASVGVGVGTSVMNDAGKEKLIEKERSSMISYVGTMLGLKVAIDGRELGCSVGSFDGRRTGIHEGTAVGPS